MLLPTGLAWVLEQERVLDQVPGNRIAKAIVNVTILYSLTDGFVRVILRSTSTGLTTA